MLSFVRTRCFANLSLLRPYSLSRLSPSELRFKEKLEEADRMRMKNAPEWEKRDQSIRKRYGEWNPTRKLSRQQMNDIRDLKARAPNIKTAQIADFFNVNPESIRRILKSNWAPSEEEQERQEARGERRKAESLQKRLAEKEQKWEMESTGSIDQTTEREQGAISEIKKNQAILTELDLRTKEKVRGHNLKPAISAGPKKFQKAFVKKKYQKDKNSPAAREREKMRIRKSRMPFTEGVGDLIE